MTANRVAVLTPPGSGAIAVLAVRGPGAWAVLRSHFRTARGGELPEFPAAKGFWFGRFGTAAADEVLLSVRGPEQFEIHCHGGRQVVNWLIGLLQSGGLEVVDWLDEPIPRFTNPVAAGLLPFARTVRTAGILLDQAQGAYDLAVVGCAPEPGRVEAVLCRNVRAGRHLVEPWTIAVAGPPNAGKSTLLNALSGFERSIVSPIPGTTRDLVSVSLALDGWPVTVTDTAGLRDALDALEGEGVTRAREAVRTSDLCLWLLDATGPRPESVAGVAAALGREPGTVLVAFNKCDLVDVPAEEMPEASRVSAATGAGVKELMARIAAILVPDPPRPGEPVPFTPDQWERWS